jgi:biotin operon repressor
VNEQDLDWQVYHLLIKDPDQDPDVITGKTGCSRDEIVSSLRRLEADGLIEQDGERYKVLSVQEILLRGQAKYDQNVPFVIEGGVIRIKKDRD